MFNITNLNSVDSILSDFHRSVNHLETLIANRTKQVDAALMAEAKAIEQRVAHSAEIDRATKAVAKIKEFLA